MFQHVYADCHDYPPVPYRQGSLHWAHLFCVTPAVRGSVMIAPVPVPQVAIDWMREDGLDIADYELAVDGDMEPVDELMGHIRAWVATKDANEIWQQAQARHLAFGGVQSMPQVAENPQFAHRGFFATVDRDGADVAMPGRLARLSDTPTPAPRPPAAGATPLEEILAAWTPRTTPNPSADGSADPVKPLDGLRILDFTWVLAGPFCTRLLGDLGADVIKLQHEERMTTVNDPAHPYYAVWNRSKRSAAIDLSHEDAPEVLRRLVETADVLLENFAGGVFQRLGLTADVLLEWNPRLIYVSMPGCGHDGPWKDVISYAPTIHALCGLTYLTNPADRRDIGPGFSLNDHAAGLAAAHQILACLEARERTGRGQYVDLAQLEVGSFLIGPAVLDQLSNDRATEPNGNADGIEPTMAPNDVYLGADDRFVAVTCESDRDRTQLAGTIGTSAVSATALDESLRGWISAQDSEDAMTQLQEAGIAAGVVQNAPEVIADAQHEARGFWQLADHPVFGERVFDRCAPLWDGYDLSPYATSPAYLGEHAFEVWALAGLDDQAVAEHIGNGLLR